MALFWTAIRRDSISLMRFSFLSSFSLEISIQWFSSHFCFLLFVVFQFIIMLPVLLLASIIIVYLILFHISDNWGSLTGVWVTASLLKSPDTLLRNVVVWIIPTPPFISLWSSPFSESFGDCTKSTNHNWYNCYFYVLCFFHFPREVEVLIFSFSFNFILWSAETAKVTILQILFFFCW